MEAEQPSAAGATSDAVGASYEDGASSAGPPCSTIAHGALSHVWPTRAITPSAIAMGVPTLVGHTRPATRRRIRVAQRTAEAAAEADAELGGGAPHAA